jgi:4-diphosphocytidyl-2-C-methyl-D-erythritol kinase
MILNAPAKLNLTFEIVGERMDHYHEIKTVMQTVGIYDRIDIEPSYITMLDGAYVAPASQNLVLRAQWALESFVEQELPCSIHLDKSIPIGAGMGGGSSDAAAVIWALNQLYHLGLCPHDLLEVGAKVGGDVPFFLIGGTCEVEGKGDRVRPLPTDQPGYTYLVFRPHKRLSSRDAYEEYDRTGKTFAEQARKKCPQIAEVLTVFPDAVISGKGPTAWVKTTEEGALGFSGVLDKFALTWDGDVFVAKPVPGCCRYAINELRAIWR